MGSGAGGLGATARSLTLPRTTLRSGGKLSSIRSRCSRTKFAFACHMKTQRNKQIEQKTIETISEPVLGLKISSVTLLTACSTRALEQDG